MFYLFIHALIITKISVLVRVGIRWILGGIREELVGDWGSYSGEKGAPFFINLYGNLQ